MGGDFETFAIFLCSGSPGDCISPMSRENGVLKAKCFCFVDVFRTVLQGHGLLSFLIFIFKLKMLLRPK